MDASHAFVPSVLPCRHAVTLRTSSVFARDTSRRVIAMSLSPDFATFRRALIKIHSPPASTKDQTNAPISTVAKTLQLDHLISQSSSITERVTSSGHLLFSTLAIRPARTLLAFTARISHRLKRIRSKHRTAYALSRMTLSVTLACVAYVVTRTTLSPTPFATITAPGSSSLASAASSSPILSNPRLPFSIKLPPKLAAIFRPFTESFGVVFLSEFGDKSMFATALMAMKHSPFIVYIGSLVALTLMTFIACFLGQLMHLLPPKVTHYSSIALFVFFGLQMILQSRNMSDVPGSAGSERADAEDMVAGVNGSESRSNPFSVLVKVSSLIFVAEWCDRSMLATMALASSNNTLAVIGGATAANVVCTGLAVFAATLVASRISERLVALVAGLLFEVFAIFTFLEGPEAQ